MSGNSTDSIDRDESEQVTLHSWHWRVVAQTEERGKLILGAHEPHRAAAKQYVAGRLDIPVTSWERTYVPRPSWDCPVCHTHEAATKQPNLRGDHDWECMVCMSKFWGEPMDWEKIVEGSKVPGHRSAPEKTDSRQSSLEEVR